MVSINDSSNNVGVKISIVPVGYDKTTIYPEFSRAPYFAILRNGELQKVVPNPFKNQMFRVSDSVVNYLMQYSPDEVIVKTIGRNAYVYLQNRGVSVRYV